MDSNEFYALSNEFSKKHKAPKSRGRCKYGRKTVCKSKPGRKPGSKPGRKPKSKSRARSSAKKVVKKLLKSKSKGRKGSRALVKSKGRKGSKALVKRKSKSPRRSRARKCTSLSRAKTGSPRYIFWSPKSKCWKPLRRR
jgi:hypothetical protein